MRLIEAETLEFKQFNQSELPRFVCLSHTWSEDEVSYQDMRLIQRLRCMSDDLKANPLYPLLLGSGTDAQFPASIEAVMARSGYIKIAETATIAY
jgi:hypothetical protein